MRGLAGGSCIDRARTAIEEGNYVEYRDEFLARYYAGTRQHA